MRTSEKVEVISAALIKAKKAFAPALKQATNPHFKSKYVDLSGVHDATESALLDNGIAVIQSPNSAAVENAVIVTTRLQHESGQWMEDDLLMPAIGRNGYDAQSVGSAITYGRRYAYMGMLGIAPEDDDGNAASGKKQEAPKGMPEPEILERLEFIKGSSTLDELQKVFTSAYKLASDSGDKRAMQAFIAGKDARKKELQ